jgi:hypothetical protein
MKATLVFESHESWDVSIGMVFTPCICWVIGKTTISNPHGDYPHYREGDFQNLLSHPKLKGILMHEIRRLVLVTQEAGHGRQEDIDLLVEDIAMSGFTFKVIQLY